MKELSTADQQELLSRPGVPEDHDTVVDIRVAELQPGDFLIGSRLIVDRRGGLPGDSSHEVVAHRRGRERRTFRWGARTSLRVTRRTA